MTVVRAATTALTRLPDCTRSQAIFTSNNFGTLMKVEDLLGCQRKMLMADDHNRQMDSLLKWGTRATRTLDNGTRGGTRPVPQEPPRIPPAGSSAVKQSAENAEVARLMRQHGLQRLQLLEAVGELVALPAVGGVGEVFLGVLDLAGERGLIALLA